MLIAPPLPLAAHRRAAADRNRSRITTRRGDARAEDQLATHAISACRRRAKFDIATGCVGTHTTRNQHGATGNGSVNTQHPLQGPSE